ncbi:hypothetical protein E2320_007522, partial [Naja naja]
QTSPALQSRSGGEERRKGRKCKQELGAREFLRLGLCALSRTRHFGGNRSRASPASLRLGKIFKCLLTDCSPENYNQLQKTMNNYSVSLVGPAPWGFRL